MNREYEQLSFFEKENKNPTDYFNDILDFFDISDDFPGWTDSFGKALNKTVNKFIDKPIRTLSLFSGGGGLDIAFHDAGFQILEMVEIDERFHKTLEINSEKGGYLEGTKANCIDIREFDPPEDLQVDFIIGGPPCQTFSAAGRRAAGVSGTDDPRGTLFQEYVRILDKLKPKGFLFENVYGIVGAQGGKPWKEILKAFKSVGYEIHFRILDTADYGVPQHRERLIIVGVKDGEFKFPRPTHGPDSKSKRPFYSPELAVYDIESDKPEFVGGRYGHLLKEIPPGLNYSFFTENFGHPNPVFAWRSKFSDFLYKADPVMPVRTLKAQGGKYTGPFHWDSRPFNIDELKRLQTFPDSYNFYGGKQVTIMQIGNSVPPHFARILAIAVLDQIFDVKLPFKMDYLLASEELGFRKRKRELSKLYKERAIKAIQEKTDGNGSSEEQQPLKSFYKYAYLGENFEFKVIAENKVKNDKDWNVYFNTNLDGKVLNISTSKQIHFYNDQKKPLVTINIKPIGKWNLPFETVNLLFFELDEYLYTAAWKMFEFILIDNNIKADLVQLNGYYQYSPQLMLSQTSVNNVKLTNIWNILKFIHEGIGIREILQIDELAALWNINDKNELKKTLISLRQMGFEVRSEFTNNQIPPDYVLLPYAFPTLTPQSVQLRKTLFPDYGLSSSNVKTH